MERGAPSSRGVVGEFVLKAQAVIVTSGGIGGNLDLVRQSWPETAGRAAQAHALRRARLRRRPHARHHRGGRRQRHQPRPHVALHRGDLQLEPDLEPARHPHPARPVVDLARRARAAPAGAAVSRLRYARHARAHHADRPRLLVVHSQPEDHRARVRAVGLRAESGPDERQLDQGHSRAPQRRCTGAGARVHGEGRGLHRRARSRQAGRAHERAGRQQLCSMRRRSSA